MKKFVITYVLTLLMTTGYAYAQVKCVPDGRGGMCCWDVGSQGPFRPIGC
jgi:hypothetical protein